MQRNLPANALPGACDQRDAPAQIKNLTHTFRSRPFQ
jgi:hypothetical protein